MLPHAPDDSENLPAEMLRFTSAGTLQHPDSREAQRDSEIRDRQIREGRGAARRPSQRRDHQHPDSRGAQRDSGEGRGDAPTSARTLQHPDSREAQRDSEIRDRQIREGRGAARRPYQRRNPQHPGSREGRQGRRRSSEAPLRVRSGQGTEDGHRHRLHSCGRVRVPGSDGGEVGITGT